MAGDERVGACDELCLGEVGDVQVVLTGLQVLLQSEDNFREGGTELWGEAPAL